ncbi:MAG: Coenzyme F420 hydrogenase/dehydrogenase, beta subunit C-terminal domain, partial [Deltaproteobacteria bacterium]
MQQLTDEIREIARKLLRDKKVEVVIGYERGSLPLRRRPCFARKAADADRLVWDGWCDNALATFLPKRKEKAAIVAKGCDSRAVVELIKEKQVRRDQVVIIGVPCRGMFNRAQLEESVDSARIARGGESPDFEEALRSEGLLLDCCKTCTHANPVL